ncbi:alpha/beta fold hydrolase [Kitasatospora sp. NPDC101176]|uniref:alpha/beta fold hydrolase n=1 Tax=Kitasatospora sp. NPDC101176 TaxID=3364099 RepID=UPI0038229575
MTTTHPPVRKPREARTAQGSAPVRLAALPADPRSVAITDLTVRTDDGALLTVALHRPAGEPAQGEATGGRDEATGTPDAGPVIVLAHGWAASRAVWHTTATLLAGAGHTVASYDQRGHATSTGESGSVSIERLAQDLGAVVDAVAGTRPVVVVGHSGGGYAALAYAARLHAEQPETAADRLVGLVLASTAAHGQETPANEVGMMGSKKFSRALGIGWLGRRLLGKTHGPAATFEARERSRHLFATTRPAIRAAFFASTQDMDQRDGLPRIDTPTTVVTGTLDKIVDPSHSRTLQQHLPQATLHTIADAGHMLPLECPQQLAEHARALATRAAR